MRGLIADIDHFAVHDGPGIRTSVFFQGCPLSCDWCHSPNMQKARIDLLYASNRCVFCGACKAVCPNALHSFDGSPPDDISHRFSRDECTACGMCTEKCAHGALSISARWVESEDLLTELLADKVFYDSSDGGVTLSGGEVLSQAAFAIEVLQGLKDNTVHSIIETSGYGKTSDLLLLAELTDLFYFDFKIYDPKIFREHAGGDVDVIFNNLSALSKKTDKITLRIPMIQGITDTVENVSHAYDKALELGITQVHLLPYNTAAPAKYDWIGYSYKLGTLSSDKDHYAYLKSIAPKALVVSII